MEEWRPIVGYEGFYSVSSLGRVRSEARSIVRSNGWVQTFSERIRKPWLRPGHGYWFVNLLKHGARRTHAVHILVCEAFHGPRPDGKEVAHWDGDGANARADNLRWATPAENQSDKLRHGTLWEGERHHWAKLSDADVREIRNSSEIQRVLAERYGVTRANISAIKIGRSRRAA